MQSGDVPEMREAVAALYVRLHVVPLAFAFELNPVDARVGLVLIQNCV